MYRAVSAAGRAAGARGARVYQRHGRDADGARARGGGAPGAGVQGAERSGYAWEELDGAVGGEGRGGA